VAPRAGRLLQAAADVSAEVEPVPGAAGVVAVAVGHAEAEEGADDSSNVHSYGKIRSFRQVTRYR